jgi:hypothetical protein
MMRASSAVSRFHDPAGARYRPTNLHPCSLNALAETAVSGVDVSTGVSINTPSGATSPLAPVIPKKVNKLPDAQQKVNDLARSIVTALQDFTESDAITFLSEVQEMMRIKADTT